MPERKLDLYKIHREEYATPKVPKLILVRPAKYLAISGKGVPGGGVFQEKAGALYSVAFTIKMKRKFAGKDYAVCKLEGLWGGTSSSKDFLTRPKSTWTWKLMIRTPDFITKRDLAGATKKLLEKGKPKEVKEVKLEKLSEGRCCQVLHVGPYDKEPETVEKMKEFARKEGLSLEGPHHEIYLSDPRRVPPDRIRTILRVPVR